MIRIIFFLLLTIKCYGQESIVHHFDSSGQKQGRWQLESVVNYIDDNGMYGGVEGVATGQFVDDERVGLWEIKDKNNKLIGQRFYLNDSTIVEIQYKKERVFSILNKKLGPWKTLNGLKVRESEYMDIITFNKKGKVKSVTSWTKKE